MPEDMGEVNQSFSAFSNKAEMYARYRWDYAAQAIQTIRERSDLRAGSWAADIGAGTGILTRHLAGNGVRVAALEPNPEMRRIAARQLAPLGGCEVIAAGAEATGLKTSAIDLICVAQAIHWFHPQAAQQEFRRILKPGGWLAILRNYAPDSQFQQAVGAFHTPEFGVEPGIRPVGSGVSPEVYFGQGQFEMLTFGFVSCQTWETFLGALISASFAPDPAHPRYAAFEHAAHTVFDQFASQGRLETPSVTELYLGRPE